MNKTTRDRLLLIAQNVVETRRPTNDQQKTILQIWDILQDGEWRTSGELAKLVERSPSYMQDQMMPTLAKAWGLASGRDGYCLPSDKPIIV